MKQTGENGISENVVIETRKRFDIDRWEHIRYNPPKFIKRYDGAKFRVDPDVFFKLCNGIYELVFKNQDIKVKFTGGEGSGKTTHATQYGQIFYYILIESNVLHKDLGTYYDYIEEECLAHDIDEYNDMSDRLQNNVFRILICDEAGSLKASNRFDKNNKSFSEKMRKDRKTLKIEILCYPNVWELNKDSVLDRTNLVVLCESSEDLYGYGATPDVAKLLVLPRGKFTFSYHSLNLISKAEMKEMLGELIKNKYVSSIQDKYIYKTYKRDDVFCFDAQKYLARAKEKGKIDSGISNFTLRPSELSILLESLTPKKLLGVGTRQLIPEHLSLEEKKQIDELNKKVNIISQLKNRIKKHVTAVEEYNIRMGIETKDEDNTFIDELIDDDDSNKEKVIEDDDSFKDLYDNV